MYIVEHRTGTGVTRKVMQGDIPERHKDTGCDFSDCLPLELLAPLRIDGITKYKKKGPTKAELDAIEAGEDPFDDVV